MTTVTANRQVVFEKFGKIARLARECIITEKIDGTNAQVHILDDGTVLAGSRNRYITPTDDNYGFAAWVQEHEYELRYGLGPGRHYGEWWGQGIQRGYGLDHKRFSLFNVSRWTHELTPECCHVVPVIWSGVFDTAAVNAVVEFLAYTGSVAAKGFMEPEGIVLYHTASNTLFKKTLYGDEAPKSKAVLVTGKQTITSNGVYV